MKKFLLSSCCKFPFRLIWQNPWKSFAKAQADAELYPSHMEKRSWAPFFYMCRELYVAIKGKVLEKRFMFISSWLELKMTSGQVPHTHRHPHVFWHHLLSLAAVLLLKKMLKPLKIFAHVTVIGYYLISSALSFLHECTACSAPPLDGQGSTQPWKSCSGFWSEFPP